LESSSADGIVQTHHDIMSGGTAGTVQPSPGQQSTDSGFVSDTSHHHHLMTYPDQLMSSDPVHPGFNSSYDSASFYSGYGQYFGCNEATGATTTMMGHNESCPNHLQNYYQQQSCCCLSNNNNSASTTTTTSTQPSWETENYNTEDLSHIVDQVLNSIDAQFCDDVPNGNGASGWSLQTANLQTVAPMQQQVTMMIGEEGKAKVEVGEKIELCDNCGNMMDQPEQQSSCGNCGHLLQRNTEPEIQRYVILLKTIFVLIYREWS